MTVIVYDGRFLAADKLDACGDLKMPCTKIFEAADGSILSGAGRASSILHLKRWYETGCKVDKWPAEVQEDENGFANLVIANQKGVMWLARGPFLLPLESIPMAWGIGREVAMGAMAMGANAMEAVEVANKICRDCGFGVDYREVTPWPKR